jgi:hypothetical protein
VSNGLAIDKSKKRIVAATHESLVHKILILKKRGKIIINM